MSKPDPTSGATPRNIRSKGMRSRVGSAARATSTRPDASTKATKRIPKQTSQDSATTPLRKSKLNQRQSAADKNRSGPTRGKKAHPRQVAPRRPAKGGQQPPRRLGANAAQTRSPILKPLLLALGALVVLAVLAGTIITVNRSEDHRTATAAASQPPLTQYRPVIGPLPATAPIPTTRGLTDRLARSLSNPALGEFSGQVTDAATGRVLWSSHPDMPKVPASTLKVLTMSAALLALPENHRLETKIVQGATPGTIVIVGGGDPTLSAQAPGNPSFFKDAPRVSDLVDQIRKTGARVDKVEVDNSLYSGPDFQSTWERGDIAGGYIAPIQALMINAGRTKTPLENYAPRTPTPALDAGRIIASALGVDPSRVSLGAAPPHAATLASVWSAPLDERMRQTMAESDNVMAEAIAMEVAGATNHPRTLQGSVRAVMDVLSKNGFNLTGVHLLDNNGLSEQDRVPAGVLSALMSAAAHPIEGNDPNRDRDAKLRGLLDLLPVAGATGTLRDRFVQQNHAAAGYVRAKTGTLSAANSLAGIVTDVDKRLLTFVLMSNGNNMQDGRPALDAIVAGLRSCGCRQ